MDELGDIIMKILWWLHTAPMWQVIIILGLGLMVVLGLMGAIGSKNKISNVNRPK